MKSRLNLTIEDSLLKSMKLYAEKQHTSVSELVENYFKTITRPKKRLNIIDLVEQLEKPKIDQTAELKDLYYEERAKKYGF
jgi:hypothetical protein